MTTTYDSPLLCTQMLWPGMDDRWAEWPILFTWKQSGLSLDTLLTLRKVAKKVIITRPGGSPANTDARYTVEKFKAEYPVADMNFLVCPENKEVLVLMLWMCLWDQTSFSCSAFVQQALMRVLPEVFDLQPTKEAI